MKPVTRVLRLIPLVLALGAASQPSDAAPNYRLPATAKPFQPVNLREELGGSLSNYFDLRTASVESPLALRKLVDKLMTSEFGRPSQRRTLVHVVTWKSTGLETRISAEQFYLLDGSNLKLLHDFGTGAGDVFRTSWNWIDFVALHAGLPAQALNGSLAYTFGAGSELRGTMLQKQPFELADSGETVPLAWMGRPSIDVYLGSPLFSFELRVKPQGTAAVETWPVATQHVQFFEKSDRAVDISVGVPFHSLHRTRIQGDRIVDDNIFRPMLFVSAPLLKRRVGGSKWFEPFVAIPLASKPLSQPIVGLAWASFYVGVSLNRIHTAGATPGMFERSLRPQVFVGFGIPLTKTYEWARRRRSNALY